MKAIKRNSILKDLSESINLQNRIIWNLRKKCLEKDLTENIKFAIKEKNKLQKEFDYNCRNCSDETKETFEIYTELSSKFKSKKVCDVNYMM